MLRLRLESAEGHSSKGGCVVCFSALRVSEENPVVRNGVLLGLGIAEAGGFWLPKAETDLRRTVCFGLPHTDVLSTHPLSRGWTAEIEMTTVWQCDVLIERCQASGTKLTAHTNTGEWMPVTEVCLVACRTVVTARQFSENLTFMRRSQPSRSRRMLGRSAHSVRMDVPRPNNR